MGIERMQLTNQDGIIGGALLDSDQPNIVNIGVGFASHTRRTPPYVFGAEYKNGNPTRLFASIRNERVLFSNTWEPTVENIVYLTQDLSTQVQDMSTHNISSSYENVDNLLSEAIGKEEGVTQERVKNIHATTQKIIAYFYSQIPPDQLDYYQTILKKINWEKRILLEVASMDFEDVATPDELTSDIILQDEVLASVQEDAITQLSASIPRMVIDQIEIFPDSHVDDTTDSSKTFHFRHRQIFSNQYLGRFGEIQGPAHWGDEICIGEGRRDVYRFEKTTNSFVASASQDIDTRRFPVWAKASVPVRLPEDIYDELISQKNNQPKINELIAVTPPEKTFPV